MSLRNKFFPVAFVLALLSSSFIYAGAAAGGAIAGTVTDPKGAVVVGATVTVTDAAGKQAHAPVATDAQGRYKIEGLPAGTYTVVVSAAGFREARREQVSSRRARLRRSTSVSKSARSRAARSRSRSPASSPTQTPSTGSYASRPSRRRSSQATTPRSTTSCCAATQRPSRCAPASCTSCRRSKVASRARSSSARASSASRLRSSTRSTASRSTPASLR